MYGLMEGQFKSIFNKADRAKGVTGENLMSLLERRFDNVVFRLGLANSRAESRMLVTQGHFTINGKKVDIPSYVMKEGDVIEVAESSKKVAKFPDSIKSSERRGVPEWLSMEAANLKGKLMRLPIRDDITMPVQEQLIVELYSK
ncbi:MAG: 30S ribosomal protein S4, partial [Deltaproteobacteria bacterium]|nr:30S ribosomal protein S4 [Deltaproteobacteria bacterium]